MTAYLFDSGLRDFSGHHYHQNLGLYHALKDKGFDVKVFTHQNVAPEIESRLNSEKLFRNYFYEYPYSMKPEAILDNYNAINKMYYEDLSKLKRQEIKSDDVLIFHTIRFMQLEAIGRFLSDLEDLPFVVIHLPFPDYMNMQSNQMVNAAFYRRAFRSMPKDKKIFITTDSDGLCSYFEQFSGRQVSLLPMPIEMRIFNQKTKNDKPLISYFGASRPQKGVYFLPEILSLTKRLRDKADFFIQLDFIEGEGEKIYTALSKFSNVTLHKGSLSDADYASAFEKTDIVLMPYEPRAYAFSTSGIFVESVASSKIIIYPKNTWLSDRAEEYGAGGVGFVRHDPSEIAVAVKYAVRKYDQYSQDAVQAAQEIQKHQGSKVFIDHVQKMMEASS